jgi:uncharacterized membrane protein YeaQ/YmgE (transglycosylase-associated protein family)
LTFGKARSKRDARQGQLFGREKEEGIHGWTHLLDCSGVDRRLACRKSDEGRGYGVVVDIILGMLGGIVGGFVLGLIGLHAGGLIGEIVVAFVGAVILVWITRKLKKA